MAKARDYIRGILAGGLPNVLDYGESATPNGAAVGNPAPETAAPAETIQDREPFLLNVTRPQILTATAIAVGIIGLIWAVRQFSK